jgi:CDP-diacylglycerol--glycerol-3-phosphate 3-phosphatidyltransferase/cardiolipin synthase
MGRYRAQDLTAPPNLVSLARVPLAAIFPFVIDRPVVALGVLALAGLSDLIDGWLARTFDRVTPLGIVLDPITDKLFVLVVVVTLVIDVRLPFPHVLLLATRELGELPLVIWWLLSHQRRRAKSENPMANLPGKLVTVLQFATVAAALFSSPHVTILLVITAIAGAIAALVYAKRELDSHSPRPRER